MEKVQVFLMKNKNLAIIAVRRTPLELYAPEEILQMASQMRGAGAP